jgi:hypothetical protein
MPSPNHFVAAVEAWIEREPAIGSAVLFGSSAAPAARDAWSDVDLHLGTEVPERLERVDWLRALPGEGFRFQVVRPGTAGIHKVTALFASGQVDLVIAPLARLRALDRAVRQGRHRRPGPCREDLNEMHVCLQSGYRFLKGEGRWGRFYARVASELPGVRLADPQVMRLAEGALVDLLWVLQKLDRGELRAAQHALHRQVGETLFRLVREWEIRRGTPPSSFGLARRVEQRLGARELRWITLDAGLDAGELRTAAWRAWAGLCELAAALVPEWSLPPGLAAVLAPYRRAGSRVAGVRRPRNPAPRRAGP